ncbi:MAG: hypothetical protein ACYSUF_09120 [Planctomycetota bacterium]|jgi:hypothetical protein
MISIGGDPAKKGKGMAITGIVLGIVFTTVQAVVGYRAYQGFGIFSNAPYVALQPGFDGDLAGLKANFGSAGGATTDQEARAFVDELRSRYGALQGSAMDFAAYQGMAMPAPDQTSFTMPWVLVFENGRVGVEMTFTEADQTAGDQIIFSSIRVIDSDLGDLTYPAPVAELIEGAVEGIEVPQEVPAEGDGP